MDSGSDILHVLIAGVRSDDSHATYSQLCRLSGGQSRSTLQRGPFLSWRADTDEKDSPRSSARAAQLKRLVPGTSKITLGQRE